MLKLLSALSVTLLSTSLPSSGAIAATRYYFAASGNDNGTCTSTDAPCRTIGKMNSLNYAAGDSILFHAGDSFTGCATINSVNVPSKGSTANPITLDSYGNGNATLLSDCPGKHALVTIDGVSGITIQNLILSANGTQTAVGILIQSSVARGTVDTVVIQNNDISGFNIVGPSNYAAEVYVGGRAINGNCGTLANIKVLNNKLHGASGPTSLDDNGITGQGCGQNITNVKYSGNEVYDIGGHFPAPGGVSGNGMLANGVKGGELSYNLVHDNGANAKTCGGPAGVWAFRSSNIDIKFNEVYRMRPLPSHPGGGACDWVAYDLDVGVTNSVVEYNYSHDNAGAALLGYAVETWGPNSFRYNISENDQTAMAGGTGSIAIASGGVSYVYNNTVYRSGSYPGTTPPSCISFGFKGTFPSGTLIANNLCINSMTDKFGRTRYLDGGNGPNVSAITVVNNLYYNPHGQDHWNWLNVEYASLAAFQAASGKDAGSIVKLPPLKNAGASGSCSWTPSQERGPQSCPTGYQMQDGPPALGAGVNLAASPYGLNVGTRDYYGSRIPHPAGSGYNIGADGSVPPRR
jgi:hypothetical protein